MKRFTRNDELNALLTTLLVVCLYIMLALLITACGSIQIGLVNINDPAVARVKTIDDVEVDSELRNADCGLVIKEPKHLTNEPPNHPNAKTPNHPTN